MLLIVAGSDLTWLTRCARTLARSTQCTLCVSVPAMDAAVDWMCPGLASRQGSQSFHKC